MKIYKYRIEADADYEGFFEQRLEMPEGAKVISCASAQGVYGVYVWAIVNPNKPLVSHWIGVLGTGHGVLGTGHSSITESELAEGTFIGTVVNHPATWHIFDLGEHR